MTYPYKIVERNVSVEARNTDKEVKNKWFWDWLLQLYINEDYLPEYAKKVDQSDVGVCGW